MKGWVNPMATNIDDNEVQGQMMLDRAKQEYSYLADKDIPFVYTPNTETENKLESWKAGEPGGDGYQRPTQIPINKFGMQVFNPEGGSPLNILGDYVSHYGVENDPKLKEYYTQFQGLLDPQAMQERYQYHTENLGEKRPYETWYDMTGLPELFRGYTFKQWGDEEEAKKNYNPQQLDVLNKVRQYLGIK